MWSIVFISTLSMALAVGCGGNSQDTRSADQERTAEPAAAAKTAESQDTAEASAPSKDLMTKTSDDREEEMIVSFALPTPLVTKDSGVEETPTDRQGLFKLALVARDKGQIDEALSYIDVLLVMQPDDAEILEFRGTIQLGKGLVEDAIVDFDHCCKLGRATCCEKKNRP